MSLVLQRRKKHQLSKYNFLCILKIVIFVAASLRTFSAYRQNR